MPTIHVARDGVKLGEFSLEQVREGLRTGQFRPTDLGWESGLPDWRPLATFVVEKAAAALPPAEAAPGAPSLAGVPATGMTPEAGLPWEHRQQLGFFKAYFDTVTVLLMKPSEAFTIMKREGGLTDPLLFALIGGSAGSIASTLFQLVVQSFFSGFGGHNNLTGIFGTRGVIFLLVLTPLLLALSMFIGSGILHLVLMILGGANRPFETTFRVVCYSCGAAYLFSIIPVCGGYVTPIYNIVLLCIGFSRAHEISTGKAVLAVLLPLLICCGVFVLLVALIIGTAGGELKSLFH